MWDAASFDVVAISRFSLSWLQGAKKSKQESREQMGRGTTLPATMSSGGRFTKKERLGDRFFLESAEESKSSIF